MRESVYACECVFREREREGERERERERERPIFGSKNILSSKKG